MLFVSLQEQKQMENLNVIFANSSKALKYTVYKTKRMTLVNLLHKIPMKAISNASKHIFVFV